MTDQPRLAAYSRRARSCIGKVCWSLVDPGIKTSAERGFGPFSGVAKNPSRFGLYESPLYGHITVLRAYGRRVAKPPKWPSSAAEVSVIALVASAGGDLPEVTQINLYAFEAIRDQSPPRKQPAMPPVSCCPSCHIQ
jgi:hypothetical protein